MGWCEQGGWGEHEEQVKDGARKFSQRCSTSTPPVGGLAYLMLKRKQWYSDRSYPGDL